MSKINVKQGAGQAPKELADKIVAGQTLPFVIKVSHKGKKPLYVPSAGLNEAIDPGKEVEVKIRSYEQAWCLVTDFASYAGVSGAKSEDFAVLDVPTPPKPVKPAAQTETGSTVK